jgi:ribosome biogenesis protein Nip4
VLRASVLECFEPLSKGEVVGIVGEDGFVYGVGLSVIDSCQEIEGLRNVDVVAENVFDVGWYLRGGTKARERKFKV